MTGLQHPLVQDYLARLDRAAAQLPPEIRAELSSDLADHLSSAVTATSTDAEVRNALLELGSPEDVAAAAYADLPGAPPAAPAAPPGPGSVGAAYPAPGYGHPVPAPSPWGAVEIIAVLGLTAGVFVAPVLGPVVGLVMAWVSTRWTKREKVVATVLTVLPVIILVVGGLSLLTISGSSGGGSTSDSDPAVVQAATPGGTP